MIRDTFVPSLEPSGEGRNDALDKCRELMERFEQRLTLDNPRLIQRYIASELYLLIRFRIGGIDEEFIACLQREKGVLGSDEYTDRWRIKIGERPPHMLPHMRYEIESWKHRTNGDQQAVFVDIVKSVECPEIIIPTLVWFERVDCFERLIPRTLHFSVFLGFVFLGIACDREIYPDRIWRIVPGVVTNNLVGQMVQGTHQVLNGIASNKGKTFGGRLNARDVINELSRLRIALGPDSIGCGMEESSDLAVNITDVLFGPFNF